MRRLAAIALSMLACAPALAQSKLNSMIGEWRGSYVCAQGPTGLTLTIDKEEGARFSGYFHFYPLKQNPVAREGCYRVEGQRAPDGRVAVGALDWLLQPPQYVTVDLAGRLGSTGYYMTGDVLGPPDLPTLCKRFELNWRSPKPAVAPACLGGQTAQGE